MFTVHPTEPKNYTLDDSSEEPSGLFRNGVAGRICSFNMVFESEEIEPFWECLAEKSLLTKELLYSYSS